MKAINIPKGTVKHITDVYFLQTVNNNGKRYCCILDVIYFRKQFQSSFTIKSKTKCPRKVSEKWPVRYAFKQDHGYTRTDQQVYWSQSIYCGRVNRYGIGKGVFAYLNKSCIVLLYYQSLF